MPYYGSQIYHNEELLKGINEGKPQCAGCGELVDEVCRDGYCRKCHVSISFDSCMNNTWMKEWRYKKE